MDWFKERYLEFRDLRPIKGYIDREIRLKEKGIDPHYDDAGKGSNILAGYNRIVLFAGTIGLLAGIYYMNEILK